jgi:hypothetical protein
VVLVVSNVAGAAVIAPGTYRLNNHPDGGARPPLYGLRLDELFNVTGGHDVFTFDFDDSRSDMRLDYDGTSIHIYGDVFGGWDTGTTYDSTYSGLWAVAFTYEPHADQAGPAQIAGDDDLFVDEATTGNLGYNTGTIQQIEDGSGNVSVGSLIGLQDYAGDFGYTFRLGDEDDDAGHRGFDGISGWGWMNHGGRGHVGASDWLFTVNQVPLPGGFVLAALGMGIAGVIRRRRK